MSILCTWVVFGFQNVECNKIENLAFVSIVSISYNHCILNLHRPVCNKRLGMVVFLMLDTRLMME